MNTSSLPLRLRLVLVPLLAVFLTNLAPASEGTVLATKGAGPLAANLPRETAVLTAPPNVPPPITRTHPAKVLVELEVSEVTKRLADGVEYTFWTFGGEVPGLFIRVREGDVVEFHLANHQSSKMPHNIDLHAVTGPGGGAASTFTAPGHASQFTFTALKPGLYVYHCATAPVPMHISNGMYGLIFVQPKEGWAPADREYYVMQGDIYTQGATGEAGLQIFDNVKAEDERPSYIVFNGSVGSMVGDKALHGESGRKSAHLFRRRRSEHHVLVSRDRRNLRSRLRRRRHEGRAGKCADHDGAVRWISDCRFRGGCSRHARARGSLADARLQQRRARHAQSQWGGISGHLLRQGSRRGVHRPGSSAGSASSKREAELVQKRADVIANTPEIANITKEIQMERGKQVFLTCCFACHMANGEGLPGHLPAAWPSRTSCKADKDRAIRAVTQGLSGPITVNGQSYNNMMPPQGFGRCADRQCAHLHHEQLGQ